MPVNPAFPVTDGDVYVGGTPKFDNVVELTSGVVKLGADGGAGATEDILKTPGSLSSKGFKEPPSKKVLNDTLAVIVGFAYVGGTPILETVGIVPTVMADTSGAEKLGAAMGIG
tara:strand:+ start:488 stop:829 length:342 start_codon:yes stop_codon:yes gene_type:complete